jgi:hypothetical protein
MVTAALAWCANAALAASPTDNAAALRDRYASLQADLTASPFQRPVLLQANASRTSPSGDVYAVVDEPFSTVSAALAPAAHWCDVLILPMNVKRCVMAGTPEQPLIRMAVGKKAEQPARDAYPIEFHHRLREREASYLAVQLDAPEGPVGTRDYRLVFEATPIDAKRTFVHMSYACENGLAARMATDVYLATTGRSKVGFSIVGRGPEGPVYVGGIQGVAERNTMRYFLAIEAYLDTLSTPESQRTEARLRHWFAATERFPLQLREMSEDAYLAMKRREIRQQAAPGNVPG